MVKRAVLSSLEVTESPWPRPRGVVGGGLTATLGALTEDQGGDEAVAGDESGVSQSEVGDGHQAGGAHDAAAGADEDGLGGHGGHQAGVGEQHHAAAGARHGLGGRGGQGGGDQRDEEDGNLQRGKSGDGQVHDLGDLTLLGHATGNAPPSRHEQYEVRDPAHSRGHGGTALPARSPSCTPARMRMALSPLPAAVRRLLRAFQEVLTRTFMLERWVGSASAELNTRHKATDAGREEAAVYIANARARDKALCIHACSTCSTCTLRRTPPSAPASRRPAR